MPSNTSEIDNQMRPRIWEYPWSYAESFLIASGLFLISLMLEYFSDISFKEILVWPINIIFLVSVFSIITILSFAFQKHPIIKWLQSIPASISAMVLFTITALLMGLIPQTLHQVDGFVGKLALTTITSSWQYAVSQIYFLTILCFVTVRRLHAFNCKNLGLFLNHAGLLIAISSALFGASDMKRIKINAYKNRPIWFGYSDNNKSHEFNFALNLLDFDIEQYKPRMTVIDNISGKIYGNSRKNITDINKGSTVLLGNWNINVTKYFETAGRIGGVYKPVHDVGTVPAAKINAINPILNDTVNGWITCGSFRMQPVSLKLSDSISLVMLEPMPRRFISNVEVFTKSGNRDTIVLEVNKPYKIDGWKLYQISYNEIMGKWSELSIIEAVRDPWLKGVYFGIFMMITGAFYLFLTGNKIKE